MFKSLLHESFLVGVIIKGKKISLYGSGKKLKQIDMSNIYYHGIIQKDTKQYIDSNNWDLIEILATIITIKDYLGWEKRKTINYKRSSYGLKHDIESLPFYNEITKQLGRSSSYLANGSLIVAMLLLDFQMATDDTPNAYFNVKRKNNL